MIRHTTISLSIAFSCGLILFSACTKTAAPLSPLGPISATGALIRAESSLVRRGTHILIENGTRTYYVESKTTNLDTFEGQTVHITGVAERNTEKNALPVLIVTSVESLFSDSGKHIWKIPDLDLRLITPESWRASLSHNVAILTLTGSTSPILTVKLLTGTTLPTGTPFYVSNRRAVRLTSEEGTGVKDIFILNKSAMYHLHFDTREQPSVTRLEDAKLLEAQFDNVVSMLTFLSDSVVPSGSSGSSVTLSCGGAAGLVCERGFYCDVYDFEMRIGTCRKSGVPAIK